MIKAMVKEERLHFRSMSVCQSGHPMAAILWHSIGMQSFCFHKLVKKKRNVCVAVLKRQQLKKQVTFNISQHGRAKDCTMVTCFDQDRYFVPCWVLFNILIVNPFFQNQELRPFFMLMTFYCMAVLAPPYNSYSSIVLKLCNIPSSCL